MNGCPNRELRIVVILSDRYCEFAQYYWRSDRWLRCECERSSVRIFHNSTGVMALRPSHCSCWHLMLLPSASSFSLVRCTVLVHETYTLTQCALFSVPPARTEIRFTGSSYALFSKKLAFCRTHWYLTRQHMWTVLREFVSLIHSPVKPVLNGSWKFECLRSEYIYTATENIY